MHILGGYDGLGASGLHHDDHMIDQAVITNLQPAWDGTEEKDYCSAELAELKRN